MKKVFQRCLLALLCAALLSGCLHSEDKGGERVISLPDQFTSGVQIVYSKVTLQGELNWIAGGGLRLAVDSPENFSGLTLLLQNGALQAGYGELFVSVDSDAVPSSAALTLLRDALRTVNGETLQPGERAASRILRLENDHGRLEVLLDEESLLPWKLSVPDLGFSAELSAIITDASE